MKQSERIRQLIELLKSKQFSSHVELLKALSKRGSPSTQATLSRDLVRLGVHKVHGIYTLGTSNHAPQITAAGPNLLVVKTSPGAASALAAKIDSAELSGLIGTVAGDDTIFVACADARSQNLIHKALLESAPNLG